MLTHLRAMRQNSTKYGTIATLFLVLFLAFTVVNGDDEFVERKTPERVSHDAHEDEATYVNIQSMCDDNRHNIDV